MGRNFKVMGRSFCTIMVRSQKNKKKQMQKQKQKQKKQNFDCIHWYFHIAKLRAVVL